MHRHNLAQKPGGGNKPALENQKSKQYSTCQWKRWASSWSVTGAAGWYWWVRWEENQHLSSPMFVQNMMYETLLCLVWFVPGTDWSGTQCGVNYRERTVMFQIPNWFNSSQSVQLQLTDCLWYISCKYLRGLFSSVVTTSLLWTIQSIGSRRSNTHRGWRPFQNGGQVNKVWNEQ